MIVTRTPLRVSFIGGGSDYPNFFSKSTGNVIGTAINQYVYIILVPLPIFAEEKFRFTYRITESVNSVNEFQHPVVRTLLNQFKVDRPLNIATMANLPGRSGLGSSSSFTVGLIKALNESFGRAMTPEQLANTAIETERTILKESGGFQDQFQAAFGGLRHYEFNKQNVSVSEELGSWEFRETLNQSMVLLPLIQSRNSQEFAKNTENQISRNVGFKLVERLSSLASETRKKITDSESPLEGLNVLAQAMSEGWEIKRKLSANVETDRRVDSIIEDGLSGGALSGRLCGAGGTGFLLFLVEPSKREKLLDKLKEYSAFAIHSESSGSKVIYKSDFDYLPLGVVN